MQQALYNDADAAAFSCALFLLTTYSQRINDATVAPSLTNRNIAFSLTRFIKACNNIITTLQNIIR